MTRQPRKNISNSVEWNLLLNKNDGYSKPTPYLWFRFQQYSLILTPLFRLCFPVVLLTAGWRLSIHPLQLFSRSATKRLGSHAPWPAHPLPRGAPHYRGRPIHRRLLYWPLIGAVSRTRAVTRCRILPLVLIPMMKFRRRCTQRYCKIIRTYFASDGWFRWLS